jgi:predicted PurR-regulated permease PerM
LLAQAGSVGRMLVRFFLTVIIAAILYANGEKVAEGVLRFAGRLAGEQGREAAVLAAKSVRAVALGIILTGVIQSAVGGLGLFVTGVPGAFLLTALIFVLCLAQVGPAPVLFPAVVWVYWSGEIGRGTILLAWAIFTSTFDNFLRAALIRKGVDLPLTLIFPGVVGGLFAFGILGLFLGPIVLAVSYTLLAAWVKGGAPNRIIVGGEED